MKIVIETDDFADYASMRRYLAQMQQESDQYGQDPEEGNEYPEGYGSMSLETRHMGINARIVGVLDWNDEIVPFKTDEG